MNIAKYIDHTLLRPDATEGEVVQICKEAKEYGFASVCVNEYYTGLVKRELAGSAVKVCAVVGFPLGANSWQVKNYEASSALENGADEIDMVINIGALKNGQDDVVLKEISELKKTVGDKVLKVIIETCLLTDDEKIKACKLAVEAKADFVKTSTGFSNGGAKVEDIRLMKGNVKDYGKVKASGGIHSYQEAVAMIDAGADRIGASAGIKIVEDSKE